MEKAANKIETLATFYLANRLYGIDVTQVQEISQTMPVTRVPLTSPHVHGLINLRGEIATAIKLKELFKIDNSDQESSMNVICSIQETLLAFLVDEVGEVIDVSSKNFEQTPETIPDYISNFMGGVYKIPGNLVSVLEIEKIYKVL